jgi:hypothetical protein
VEGTTVLPARVATASIGEGTNSFIDQIEMTQRNIQIQRQICSTIVINFMYAFLYRCEEP